MVHKKRKPGQRKSSGFMPPKNTRKKKSEKRVKQQLCSEGGEACGSELFQREHDGSFPWDVLGLDENDPNTI